MSYKPLLKSLTEKPKKAAPYLDLNDAFSHWTKLNDTLKKMPLDSHSYSCGYGNSLEYDYQTAFADNPTDINLGEKYLASLTHHNLRGLIGAFGSTLNKRAQTTNWQKSRATLNKLISDYYQIIKFGKNTLEQQTFIGASDNRRVAFDEDAIHAAERKCPFYHSSEGLKNRLLEKEVDITKGPIKNIDHQDTNISTYYDKKFQVISKKEPYLYLKGSKEPIKNHISTNNDLSISSVEALTLFSLAARGMLDNLKMPTSLGFVLTSHLQGGHNVYPNVLGILKNIGLDNNPILQEIAQKSLINFQQQLLSALTPKQLNTLNNHETTAKIISCLAIDCYS